MSYGLSDQTINSNGFRVLTSGIKIDRFLKNPVMLYMHDREKGVIGRWDDVRKASERLVGVPVFDTESELGKEVAQKVAGGFLRGASIGIDNVSMENVNGTMTVTSCTLEEVSIVDIPSNENAVTLYSNKRAVSFSKYLQSKLGDESRRLAYVLSALGLPENASDGEITARITLMKRGDVADAYMAISEARACGAIMPKEYEFYMNLAAKYDAKNVTAMVKEKTRMEKENTARQVEALVKRANFEQRITADNVPFFLEVGAKTGASALGQILNLIPRPRRIIDMLGANAKEVSTSRLSDPEDGLDRSQWTLDDWRKNDPVGLKNDPVLYDKLVAQSFKLKK